MSSVAARYEVFLYNRNGEVAEIFTDFDRLEWGKTIDDVGYYLLEFSDSRSTQLESFLLDSKVKIKRSIPGVGLDWYDEFVGLHVDDDSEILNDGKTLFVSSGVDFNDFLARTIIGYKAGTVKADKSAPAETVMKEYVEENCGPSATVAFGREYNGVLPGFTVEHNFGRGEIWSGSREFESLLDVLKEIAASKLIDFEVVENGKTGFIFRTYPDQLGLNKTYEGVDGATGLNKFGNSPVLFSTDQENISGILYQRKISGSANIIYVLGSGTGATRTVVVRDNYTDRVLSPFNRREVSRPGSNQEFEYQLADLGDEILAELKFTENFDFEPLQVPSCLYGQDFVMGDRVSIKYGTKIAHRRLVGVQGVYEGDREVLKFFHSDVPRSVK